jgi:hypothetical protein
VLKGTAPFADTPAGAGYATVFLLATLAGLGVQIAGVMEVGFALSAGQAVAEGWPFVAVTWVCWAAAAAVAIRARVAAARGALGWTETWWRAGGAALVALLAWAAAFAVVALLAIDGVVGLLVLFGGWAALTAALSRRLVGV